MRLLSNKELLVQVERALGADLTIKLDRIRADQSVAQAQLQSEWRDIHYVGSVVTEAQPLMVVVPESTQVTAEVNLAQGALGLETGSSNSRRIAAKSFKNMEPAFGNDRSSKFTAVQAQQFIDEGWTVVEHKSDTTTGFSGTLFKYTGATDAAKGLTKGELVMSLRSTEFADDATCDNQATNVLEIKEKGWAFGQIADMESWCASLQTSNGPVRRACSNGCWMCRTATPLSCRRTGCHTSACLP